MKAYFFGVKDAGRAGHYIYDENLTSSRHISNVLPFNYEHLDGIMRLTVQNQCCLIKFELGNKTWTVLIFPDYTGDERPKSNSAFIFENNFIFTECLEFAEKIFPEQFKRVTSQQPLKLYGA